MRTPYLVVDDLASVKRAVELAIRSAIAAKLNVLQLYSTDLHLKIDMARCALLLGYSAAVTRISTDILITPLDHLIN